MTTSAQGLDPQVVGMRVQELQRQMTAYKILAVLALLLSAGALSLAYLSANRSAVEAGSFALIGSDGTVLAQLGASDQGAPGLYLYGKDKAPRLWLGLLPDGSPHLIMSDAKGKPRASLVLDAAHQGQPRLYIGDANGTTRATLGLSDDGGPTLDFAGQDGKPVFSLPPSAGATPEERWNTYNTAATRALAAKQFDQAERLYVAAINEAKTLGPVDLRLAAAYNNLGVLYVQERRFEDADKLYAAALAIRKKVLGDDNPQVAQSLGNVGFLRMAQGRLQDAEPMFKHSLEILEKAFGKDDPRLSATLSNYAQLLHQLKRDKEAEKLEERIKELQDKQAKSEGKE